MKLVKAIIQPDKLDEVREALIAAEIYRITVSRVAGHGRQAEEDIYRGQAVAPGLISKVQLEIAVNDEFVDKVVAAIIQGAKHDDGKIGDGKIMVQPLEEIIRIRTGERGNQAI